jgi:biotin transport system substrate-specific component
MHAAHPAALVNATLVNVVATRSEDRVERNAIRAASVLFITVLTAAAAQISFPLPFTQVPFTFQPMVVLVGGLVLGSRLGFASQVLYLTAGIAGLPVFAASVTLPPGFWRLLGPTGGYLMAYPFAAFVVGYLAERGWARRYATSVAAMLVGLAIIYLAGTLWLAYFARLLSGSAAVGFAAALASGVYPFVLADLAKLVAAAGITPGLWRLIGTR